MCGLILFTIGLRPFGTFMEGLINCTIWATGVLASVSYHLFSEGKLVGVGNKACTYTVVALTFVVMFAIVVHVMLGVFSKERIDARTKKAKIIAPAVDAENVLSDAVRMIPSQEVLEPPKLVEETPVEVQAPAEDPFTSMKNYFFSMFASAEKEPESAVEMQNLAQEEVAPGAVENVISARS